MATINGTAVANLLNGTAAADTISGLGGNDTLNGSGGNDRLDGGTGNDSMVGGAGNDLYIVDSALDKVVEAAGGGTDTVQSSITYTLLTNFENLTLSGAAAINGTGNTVGNVITGNTGNNILNGLGGNDTLNGGAGNDTLDGGTGNDSMNGGAGNDRLIVNAAGDITTEGVNQGTDTVQSAVTRTLGANLENLVLSGATNINGTGNELANVITGNTGNNILAGGAGNDTLNGGAGNDTLVWDAADAFNGSTGADTLRVDGADVMVDLVALSNTRMLGIEIVNLAGSGDNTLKLVVGDVTSMSDTDVLRVDGGAGDVVNAGGGWTRGADVTIGAETYAQYTGGGATLQVDLDIDRAGVILGELKLSQLDGANGFRLDGIDAVDLSGVAVAGVGDFNGDGFDDLLIGAPLSEGVYQAAGESYLVFGNASGFGPSLALSDLNGFNGFQLNGVDLYDISGLSVASAGDHNGDGFADLVIGASQADTQTGESYLVFGGSFGSSPAADVNLSGAFRLVGIDSQDSSGQSLASAGDFNGDGFDDLLVGAPGADPNGASSGESYLVFGKASGFGSGLSLSALNGTNGFRIDGHYSNDNSGASVSSAGDFNGDGLADLVIGALGGNGYQGWTYVVFGAATGFGSSLALSSLNGGNGFRLDGVGAGDRAATVAAAGDVNGDGIGDLIVGARYANGEAGRSYVVFGSESGFDSSFALSDLDGFNGFRLDGIDAGDRSGAAVAAAGDFNGDGYDDLIIGARNANGNAGESYVVFGKASGFGASLAFSALDGTNGFRLTGIDGGDGSGVSVASAGDLNGDGFDDLVLGAPYANGSAGETYVVYGRDWNGAVDFTGGAGSETLTGTAAAEVFVGGAGDDTLTGGGGADVFRGGAGDDLIEIASASFADVDGGNGSDTLALAGSSLSLDLTTIRDGRVAGIERIDLTGSGNNTLTLDAAEVRNLSNTSNTLRVVGNAGDAVFAGGGWTQIQDGVDADGSYAQYTKDGATLRVDMDVNRGGIGVADLSLSVLNGSNGFRLDGIGGSFSGGAVASAGDVNGDGYGDVIVGATGPNGFAGASYVVFGQATGFNSSLALSTLNGANGFSLDGTGGSFSGGSVASAGDVNGDGYGDLIVGASFAGSAAGESYVVYGQASGFSSTLALSALDGSNGFRLDGIDSGDRSGLSVDSAGDVNGDGYDDLIVGGYYANSATGESYVVFGSASGPGSELDLSALNGANGFRLDGIDPGDRSGFSVSSAGDVNGDGYDDMIVGAYGAYGNAGESYVVYGMGSAFASSVALAGLNGSNGFRLDGVDLSDHSGFSVSGAGDVNGDGYGDLIVGARYANGNAGESYVVFGSASLGSILDLSALDGSNGFRLDGDSVGDLSGRSVSSAGDVNADGYDDLIVGAFKANGEAGESYVVFGKASGFNSSIQLSGLDGVNGFRIAGIDASDRSGASVSSAGDVNGDGYDDLIVGGYGANGGAGESYVIYGRDFTGAVDFHGTAGPDLLTGTAAAEVFVGGRRNDTIAGGGGADVINGGAGNDRIHLLDTQFAAMQAVRIDGGSGRDALVLVESGMELDLTQLVDSRITGIETIDLGGGGNDLTVGLRDVLNLSDTSNTLTVDGGEDDAVTVADGSWTDAGVVGDYHVYTSDTAARLRIHVDITDVSITL